MTIWKLTRTSQTAFLLCFRMCLLLMTVQMSAFSHIPRITLSRICPSRVVPNLLSGQAALLLANCRHYTSVFIKDCQHGAVLLCEIICSCKDTLNLAVALSLVKGIARCYIRDESLQRQPATAVFATHFGKINNYCLSPSLVITKLLIRLLFGGILSVPVNYLP